MIGKMKAVVLSDSHRNFNSILRIMKKEQGVNYIIHAGDVQRDVDDILDAWPQIPCIYVVGNNDFSVWDVPTRREFCLGDKRFLLTHGHLYGVKSTLARLHQEAAACKADICIFGHTHVQHLEERNGITLLNPGSTRRSYATIEMQNGNVDIQLKETP